MTSNPGNRGHTVINCTVVRRHGGSRGWKSAEALRRGSGELHALVMTDNKWLVTYPGEFTVRDDSGKRFKARWAWEPTIPCKRNAGIIGWAIMDGKKERLHICAHTPCKAM